MSVAELANKVVLLAPYNDAFSEVVLDNVVQYSSLDHSDVVILRYSRNNKKPIGCKRKSKYKEIEWRDLCLKAVPELSCLFSMSLQPSSAKIIRELEGEAKVSFSSVYMLATGDEVDRWSSLFREKGKLEVNNVALVDQNVLSVIDSAAKLVAPAAWRKKEIVQYLESEKFIDSYIPFTVLSEQLSSQINHMDSATDEFYFCQPGSRPNRVLVGTKYSGYFNLVFFLKLFFASFYYRKNVEVPLVLGVWVPMNLTGLAIYFLITLTSFSSGRKMRFEILNSLSRAQYFLMLKSFDLLIAQERGGGSAIREMLKLRNSVIFKEGSVNHRSIYFRVPGEYVTYRSFSSAINLAFSFKRSDFLYDGLDRALHTFDEKASKNIARLMWESIQ